VTQQPEAPSSSGDVLAGRDARRTERRPLVWGVVGVLGLGAVIVGIVLAAGRHDSGPSRVAVHSPTVTPSSYIGLGNGAQWGGGPNNVSMSFGVWNLTDLDLRIDAVHLVLAHSGNAQVLTADMTPELQQQGAALRLVSTLRRRSPAYLHIALRPDCASRDASGYVNVDLTTPDGAVVHQRLDLPTEMKLSELIANACNAATPTLGGPT
jgi:hypothetical protein